MKTKAKTNGSANHSGENGDQGPDFSGKSRESIHEVMPSRNFSTHLLQEVPKHVAVMELRDAVWSDWGKPKRIAQTLRHIGREPVFCRAHFA